MLHKQNKGKYVRKYAASKTLISSVVKYQNIVKNIFLFRKRRLFVCSRRPTYTDSNNNKTEQQNQNTSENEPMKRIAVYMKNEEKHRVAINQHENFLGLPVDFFLFWNFPELLLSTGLFKRLVYPNITIT